MITGSLHLIHVEVRKNQQEHRHPARRLPDSPAMKVTGVMGSDTFTGPKSCSYLALYGLVFSRWRNAVTEMTSTDRMW